MNYYTSDWHIGGHEFIAVKLRGFASVKDHDEFIIERFSATLKPEDTLYILGDLTLENPRSVKPMLDQIPGKKILLLGNHDRSINAYNGMGFALVANRIDTKIANKRIILNHYPWKKDWYLTIRSHLLYKRQFPDHDNPIDDGKTYVMHGHTHSIEKFNGRMLNVTVDAWDYRPVSQFDVETIINQNESGSHKLMPKGAWL